MIDTGLLWGVVLAGLLILVNAFFVAAEFAIVRVRETQVTELAAAGSARARLAAHILRRIDAYLSACQVGITAASLALGAVAEPYIARLIEPVFGWIAQTSETLFHALSFAIAFGLITYLHIILGEQAPKYLAIRRALGTTLWSAYPLHVFFRITYPFIWFVNASANWVLRLFGVKAGTGIEAYSEEELRLLVAASARTGMLAETERELLQNVLGFADKVVRQVMVPRTEIVAVEAGSTIADVVELAQKHPFTRYPVYREDLDNVIGIVHVRDLVGVSPELAKRTRVTQGMRRVVAIPESMHLDRALAEMRRQRIPLFLVIDEFGGTAGLVTMEDILEELVGELEDEFDRGTPLVRRQDDGSYLVDGLTSLEEARDRLGLTLQDEPYDTIGGLVFGKLGRLARIGDGVEVEGMRLEVTAMDGRRIAQVRARPIGRAASKPP